MSVLSSVHQSRVADRGKFLTSKPPNATDITNRGYDLLFHTTEHPQASRPSTRIAVMYHLDT